MNSSAPFTMLPSSSEASSGSSSSPSSSISYSSLLRDSRNRRARKNEQDEANSSATPSAANGASGLSSAASSHVSRGRHLDEIELKETRVNISSNERHRRNDSRNTPNYDDGHDSSLLIPSSQAARRDPSPTMVPTPGNGSPALQPELNAAFQPRGAALAFTSAAAFAASSSSSSSSSSSAPTIASIPGEARATSIREGCARGCGTCLIRLCSPFALLRIYPLVFVVLIIACTLLFIQGELLGGITMLCFTLLILMLYVFRLWLFCRFRDHPLNRADGGDYHRVDQLFEEEHEGALHGRSRWGFGNTAVRLAAVDRDFTANDYEMLLRLDEENGGQRHGMHQSQIERLPQFVLKKSLTTPTPDGDDESKKNNEDDSNCSICLDTKKPGDTLRGLPCMHSFHRECVDKWLRRKNVCPTCRLPVNLDGRGSFFSPTAASSLNAAAASVATTEATSELRRALGDLSTDEIEALQEAIAMEQSLREASTSTTSGQTDTAATI